MWPHRRGRPVLVTTISVSLLLTTAVRVVVQASPRRSVTTIGVPGSWSLAGRSATCAPSSTAPQPLVIVVSILLIIFGGSWGLTQWLSSRVQRLLETQETLQLELAQTQTALDQLQAETWGVWLHEEDGMRYVVLPRGTLNEEWPLTVDGQPAIRLSSE